jgi:serine protease Do
METKPRSKSRALVGAVVTAIAMLIIGMMGGVWGFLILSNQDNPSVAALRQRLGIGDDASIPTTVTKKIQLDEGSDFIDAVKKIESSVVSVVTTYQSQDMFGYSLGSAKGGGSGFIITSDGYILTNKHVVDGQATVKVTTFDEKEYDAKVVSTDPLNDLAVLKIEAKDLRPVELGDSDRLALGQWVLAVGTPFGEFENTVTLGIISAKNRSLSASGSLTGQSESLTGLLQTDAAINPGNSGGPLVNLDGQVVGITTAIASSSGTSSGVGFAIPANSFRGVIESIKQYGRIVRPGLGVRYLPITKAMAERNSLTVQHGALIVKGETTVEVAVLAGSPADKAGLKEGDILLSLNDEDITIDNPLTQILTRYTIGQTVTVKYLRDGAEKSVEVKFEEIK